MNRLLAALAAFLVLSPLVLVLDTEAQTAGQGTANLSWILATTYTDNSPMVRQDQRVYRSSVQGHCITNLVNPTRGPTCVKIADAGVNATSYVNSGLYNGTWYYTVTTVDFFLTESFSSNEAFKVINIVGNIQPPAPGVRPNPQTALTVL